MKAILVSILAVKLAIIATAADTQDLAGKWRFALDPENAGVDGKWFGNVLDDVVTLPGTTDENHKGILKDEAPIDRLARVWYWQGAAWYQKDVVIPESWVGKRVTLELERTKNTRVWLNDQFCGWNDTLSAPQVFDLTKAVKDLKPGKHTLTLLVDNSILPPVGPSHAVDERTQTNWNGVLGKIELRATDPVWVEDIQVNPDVTKGLVRVRATLGNATGKPVEGSFKVVCRTANTRSVAEYKQQIGFFGIEKQRAVVEFNYDPGEKLPLWDEFNTALISMQMDLSVKLGDQSFSDSKSIRFGMCEFTREGSQLLINGKPVFLRGRLDCANYPLTGYPPMDKASWLKIIGILKDWGMNHVRFHSWCPPQAAFDAADELGMYFQAELPNKRSGFKAAENQDAAIHNIDRLAVNESNDKVSLYDYGKREGELILKHFGNSPSFVMFTLGNELGRNQGMFELVEHFRAIDPRKLYAQGANNMHWDPSLAEGDDFWVAKSLEKSARLIRGSDSVFNPGLMPHIEFEEPSTMVDYIDEIAGCPVPAIGHETGQFQVYPDFRDIAKFTGVTRAKNFEIFRDRLKAAGMLDQAQAFVDASGKLAAICYREDIEAALRTPGFGGIQLLDIQDFPGQGTALVGMLNDFMENKGFIQPDEWRQFCSEVVPLVRMKRYVWTVDETFACEFQVAHYGPSDFINSTVQVALSNHDGKLLKQVELTGVNLKAGKLNTVGDFGIKWSSLAFDAPQRLTLTVAIAGTSHRNQYPLWVYPAKVDTQVPDGVVLTRSFHDPATRKHLDAGGKVLLLPKLDELPRSVAGGFQTDFWSPMFTQAALKRGVPPPPGTLGILTDPESPAFNAFPTEFHSNWQWWHLVKNSRPILFDDTAADFRPLVQVIDNFDRNHKLGLIAETKVGKGAMLICSIDLLGTKDEEPAARQLLHSLQQYVASPDFTPDGEISPELLEKLFPH